MRRSHLLQRLLLRLNMSSVIMFWLPSKKNGEVGMQKILVVEDYRELSDFFALALTSGDRYAVLAAENGSAALSLLEAEHPDLALIDVRIPDVPGIDVSSRALALDIPVVLMTGDFEVSDCSTALSKVDDSKLGDEVELFGGHKGPRAFALFALTNDWADHYSSAAMYLRLNGLLPPTAQPKK